MKYLLIAVGGGAGSLARYLAATAILARVGEDYPILGTMTINITGSFAIGLLMTLIAEKVIPDATMRPLLVIGFLGGFTTFSSFEWETYSVARHSHPWMAIVNVLASVAVGYAAVSLGAWLARR